MLLQSSAKTVSPSRQPGKVYPSQPTQILEGVAQQKTNSRRIRTLLDESMIPSPIQILHGIHIYLRASELELATFHKQGAREKLGQTTENMTHFR